METRIRTDFLVIGSGIAGLSFALKAAAAGKVIVVTKSSVDETNTRYAQGGIAAVMYDPDSVEKHVRDTLKAVMAIAMRSCADGCSRSTHRKIES